MVDNYRGHEKQHPPQGYLETIQEGGVTIGMLAAEFINDPPAYYLKEFFSQPKKQGVGTELIKKFNAFLLTNQQCGILFNSPGSTIYARNGWLPVESEEGWLTFNKPEDLDNDKLFNLIRSLEMR